MGGRLFTPKVGHCPSAHVQLLRLGEEDTSLFLVTRLQTFVRSIEKRFPGSAKHSHGVSRSHERAFTRYLYNSLYKDKPFFVPSLFFSLYAHKLRPGRT